MAFARLRSRSVSVAPSAGDDANRGRGSGGEAGKSDPDESRGHSARLPQRGEQLVRGLENHAIRYHRLSERVLRRARLEIEVAEFNGDRSRRQSLATEAGGRSCPEPQQLSLNLGVLVQILPECLIPREAAVHFAVRHRSFVASVRAVPEPCG